MRMKLVAGRRSGRGRGGDGVRGRLGGGQEEAAWAQRYGVRYVGMPGQAWPGVTRVFDSTLGVYRYGVDAGERRAPG